MMMTTMTNTSYITLRESRLVYASLQYKKVQ